jgi:NAD(P)H-nitrite reductase large subunit
MHHVILGAGVAGIVAAETIRGRDSNATITVIGEEREPPYSRMAIPYFLADDIAEAGTYLRKNPGHYQKLGIEHIYEKAVAVDAAGRALTLSDGIRVSYDRLLIATGASPIRPPVPGIDLPFVQTCWTLADARKIAAQAKPGAKVVLMGAGFIGCIIMEALVARQVELTVVEMGDRMVPRMMNQVAGTMIRRWAEAKGVSVRTSARIAEIRDRRTPKGFSLFGSKPQLPPAVVLADGTEIPADMVICAAGVRPNTGFLAGAGIAIDQGIVVDEFLRSNVPEVFAAGDVAQGPDFFSGGSVVHAIQPTSSDHGRIAGINMTGGETAYQGSLVMNVLDTMGLISVSYGAWEGVAGGDSIERVDADRFQYVNLAFKDDVLIGAITLGHTRQVGCLRGLIQGKIRLGKWKARLMADPTRMAEAWLAQGMGAAG